MESDDSKLAVAISSAVAAVFLTAIKLVAGLSTGSLGILSEAAHSALDLVAALLTVAAVSVSGRPPDQDHHYGHAKAENLSALFETLLLLGTCFWIVKEACERLMGSVAARPTPASIAVMAVAIVVDATRARALKRAAERYGSQALEADALHFSTDILSSVVVILGLGATMAGQRLGIVWLSKADPIAALGVAAIVVWISLNLGRRTLDALTDRAPEELVPLVSEAARAVAGVAEVGRVRLRTAGQRTFVELILKIRRSMPMAQADRLIDDVRAAVTRRVAGADVVVQLQPGLMDSESIEEKVRLAADRTHSKIHNLAIHRVEGALYVNMHLEVAAGMRLSQAHELATRLEEEIRGEVPEARDVLIRVEGRHTDIDASAPPAQALQIADQLIRLARSVQGVADCLDVVIGHGNDALTVSARCRFEGALPVEEVNRIAGVVEELWRREVPAIGRITLHQEPVPVAIADPVHPAVN